MKVLATVVGVIALITTMLVALLWIQHSTKHDPANEVALSFSETSQRHLDDAFTKVLEGQVSSQGEMYDFLEGDASSALADPEADAIWINDDLFEAEQLAAWADKLGAHGLRWPQRNPDLADGVADANIRAREAQAMRMIDHNPVQAVAFISAQLEFEEDKVVTRRLRHAWEASRTEKTGVIGDPERFVEMFRHAPDRHFDGLVDLYVDDRIPSDYLGRIVGEALERPSALSLPALARLADRELLPEHGTGMLARQALTDFLGDAPQAFDSWHFAVVERFERMEFSEAPPADH